MRTDDRGHRETRTEPTTRESSTLLVRVMLVVALVLFTILWLLLAPGSAAAAI